jgi:hypothetical protein
VEREWREGGREGWREGGRDGGREGGREREREREGEGEGERERERERERGREREHQFCLSIASIVWLNFCADVYRYNIHFHSGNRECSMCVNCKPY